MSHYNHTMPSCIPVSSYVSKCSFPRSRISTSCSDLEKMMSLKRSAESSSGAATANKMARNRLGTRSRTPADATNVNMNVYVRIRPLNTREQGCRVIASVLNDKTMVFDPKEDSEPFFFKGSAQKGRDINRKVNKNMLFEFNRVFDENSTNEEVFCATTKNIVKSVLEGYNCSVFAYGATGAGKTFTMLGSPDNPGITYRTIVELLKQIDMMEGWKITIGASYIEVYNENVRDLLHPDTGMLQLREEEGGRVLVAGLRVETIRSSDQLFSLLAEGNRNRSQHPTDSNAESSRSHAVFQVHVRMEFQTDVKLAKLSMIDLAGSERGAATGCKGLRFKEGSNINKSLLSLGNCINALADGLKHVPYRDSKLTRILKDSLGGNCQTMMIANVSPASLAFEDTYNTLKYATRAKSIKSKVSKNVLSESLLSVAQYRKVVDELKQQLSKLENVVANNVNITNLHEWEQKIAAVMEEQKKIHKEMLTLQSEERLTQLRLKHKNNTLTMQDSTDESSNRTQIGIDQLTGRLESFRSRLEEYKPLLASNMEKVEALEKEIQQHPQLAPFLKHILDKYRYEIENENKAICLKHQWKITQLQAKQEERHTAAISYFPSVLKEFHCLLRAHGHLTNELDARYQTALKTFEGLKGVSFIDDENRELTEQEKLLRLSMGPVRDKPIVSEEEMNNHKKTVTFPLKEQCQNKMNSTFNTNGFKSTSLAKLPLKPTPSKPLFRNFSFSNKENSVSPAPPRLAPPGGTPGVTGRGAGFKAVRPSSNTLRTNPYMRSGIRSGIISKPRLNKLAAARMTAAVR